METVVDIPVSLDDSWKSRYMSQHGMVAAISADTGEVVDCYCACSVCSQYKKWDGKLRDTVEYLEWYVEHSDLCWQNHTGSAQSMECTGVGILYGRSMDNNVRYCSYIGDGDSKSFKQVIKDKRYGPSFPHSKEECVGHVQKRMETRLRRKVEKSKGNL